jgi:beta-galactosidase
MIIGAQYERMPNPRPEDWERDLRHIAGMGLAVIRTWLYWRKVNPAPGAWVWDHYDRLFDAAGRHGVKVQIQLFCEAPPEYLIRAHPDWAYMDGEGRVDRYYRRPAQQVGGFQGFDYAHPAARAAAIDYITRVAGRYRDHPALYGYDVWNEVWMSQWLDSPDSRAMRQAFLHERYGSLDGLNRAWCQDYTDWSQVEDPRQSLPIGLKGIVEGLHVDNMDMLAFENHARAWHMGWRCAAAREADPGHPVMSHVGGDEATLRFDSWSLAPHTDIWGVSAHAPDLASYALACQACSAAAAGRPWWLTENSSGRFYLGLDAEQRSPDFLRSTHVLALMHGASGDIFWQYRPEIFGQESPNFGLVGLGGEPTERSACVAGLARMHREHAAVLDHLQFAPPQVGLVYSPRCAVLQQVEGGDRHWRNFQGWHAALCHRGLTPQLLRDEDLAGDGIPPQVTILFAPMQLIETPGLGARLEAWARAGGTLVGGPWHALYDRDLRANRRCPGTDLFGVRQVDFSRAPAGALTCLGPVRGAGSLPHGGVVERLALESADTQPLAVFGDAVAAAARPVGRGRAVYVGCQPGLAYEADAAPQLGAFAELLCAQAGVSPAVRLTGGCYFRAGHSPYGDVVLAVHPGRAAAPCWLEGTDSPAATDLLSGEILPLRPGRGGAAVPMAAQGARILLLQ